MPSDRRYVLGLDFGTLSGRALLVDVDRGEEIATAIHEYPSGVIEHRLPGYKQPLHPAAALQDPRDYIEVLALAIPKVLRAAGIKPAQVIGIGIDFTSCTMLPTTAAGIPLCTQARWRKNPHAWVKLWKHHAAQSAADVINRVGKGRKEYFLRAYGGRYSSEWFFSKLLETVREAPAVYAAADRFIEAGDWLVWRLCGAEQRSHSAAGFKAMRVYPTEGARRLEAEGRVSGVEGLSGATSGWNYPSPAFFGALHPKLRDVVEEKLGGNVLPLGASAGGLTEEMAALTGLNAGTPVATANIDAHAAVPGCGVTSSGKLVMIIGTSTCHLLVDEKQRHVEGQCGVVAGGVIPGLWGYEAGQAGVGDLFAWFIAQGIPARVEQEAKAAGVTLFEWLGQQAAPLRPGETGLLALDWWSGCRSVLMDSDLTGVLLGLTLATRPHEIYRALVEATAFGTRKIIAAFADSGMRIGEIYACGGLPRKSPLLMQIYADVTGRPIRVAASEQTSALGAAIYAAVAAGAYPNIKAAARHMVRPATLTYRPCSRAHSVYSRLYAQYSRLHDSMGRDPGSVMKELQQIKVEA